MRANKTPPMESTQMTLTKKTAGRTDETMKQTATNQARARSLRTSSPQSARYRTSSNAPMWTSAAE
jgi:hypothetical protein